MMQLSGWILIIVVVASATATQEEYDRGFALGQQAYKYGLPLITMQWTYEVQTNTTPVNSLEHHRIFTGPEFTTVVAPNFDTLYSTGWLDLSREPIIIHVPEQMYDVVNGVQHRLWDIAFYDPYTNNFHNLGSVQKSTPGYYAVFGPKGKSYPMPPSCWKVNSPYNRVWIIVRIYAINGNEDDIKYVNSLQDRITVTSRSRYLESLLGLLFPSWPVWNQPDQPTVSNPVMPTGMAYYDALCQQLSQFPPPDVDSQYLASLQEIGIRSGATPSTNAALSSDTIAGMIAAIANGSAAVKTDLVVMYKSTFNAHNGYLILKTGVYNIDYILRALVAQIGLGALVPEVAIYPIALFDRTSLPLVGTKNYTVHIPSGGLPPVDGFWSVTMYNTKGFLIANEINRYLINDCTDLHYNEDGSADLFIQAHAPTDPNKAQNWLPSPPNAAFQLIWRLYATKPEAIDGVLDGSGWQPPAIMPVS